MTWLTNLLESHAFLVLLGVAALTVLMAVGTLSTTVGVPLLAGLLGLGTGSAITTAATAAAQNKSTNG